MCKADQQPSRDGTNDKLRVLVISDSVECLGKIRAALTRDEIEITCAASAEEMCRGCCGWNDLVLVDFDPPHLTEILGTLRRCAGCTEIPVLVEASRLSADSSLVGQWH
ncbi:MAG: hypothetical protein AB7P14_07800 [Blastocatellales bacterium]